MKPPAERFVIGREFDDFDEFCEVVRAWNLELCQLDHGPFSGELFQAGCGEIIFTVARIGRHQQQTGAPPLDLWTFGIPLQECPPFLWRRRRITPGDILVFRPGSELDSISPDGFCVYTFSVPEELLNRIGATLVLPDVLDLPGDGGVVRAPPPTWRDLIQSMDEVHRELTETPTLIDIGALAHHLEFEITSRLLKCLHSPSDFQERSSPRLRDRVMDRAEDYLAENGDTPLTLERLCDVTRASQRTLRRAFQERFGVSPRTYLKAFRLNGLRKELRRNHPSTTKVADAAASWGFWHMGKLAADYRTMFGELPSETLRSRPARPVGRE